ncbi:hypothetical protein HDU98_004790 [Podochytrium sp. JEL0797]|nr:hypothetical protein HDU98_004790 [Podochytrium sp. JEL0797]
MPAAVAPSRYSTNHAQFSYGSTGSARLSTPSTRISRKTTPLGDIATAAFARLAALPPRQVVLFASFAQRLLAQLATHSSPADALAALLAAVLFAKRFLATQAIATASQGFAFRLLATSLMVAVKIADDTHLVRSKEWISICENDDLSLNEMANMEREFLKAIDYNVSTPPAELKDLANALLDMFEDSNRGDAAAAGVLLVRFSVLLDECC